MGIIADAQPKNTFFIKVDFSATALEKKPSQVRPSSVSIIEAQSFGPADFFDVSTTNYFQ